MFGSADIILLLLVVKSSNLFQGVEGTFHKIAGYHTNSKVYGSTIDLDQAEIIHQLSKGDFDRAKAIFLQGEHTDPYAILTFDEPIKRDEILAHVPGTLDTEIHASGSTEDGTSIVGNVVIPFKPGDDGNYKSKTILKKGQTTVRIGYDHNVHHVHPKLCAVGAREEPVLDGCFASEGGLIIDGYGLWENYKYNPLTDNGFLSTLHSFNEFHHDNIHNVNGHVHEDTNDGIHYGKSSMTTHKVPIDLHRYFMYYHQMNYGNHWIDAAFDGVPTSFSLKAVIGNTDFSLLSQTGRAYAIQTATVTMNVFLKVMRLMNEATRPVKHGKKSKKDDGNIDYLYHPMNAAEIWDTAVATYTGSLEGPHGTGVGYLLYGLADQLCIDFATCKLNHNDDSGSPISDFSATAATTAKVNLDLIRLFQDGHQHLVENCHDTHHSKCIHHARQTKLHIEQMMLVPLIQGTLRSAHRLYQHHNIKPESLKDKQVEEIEIGKGIAFLSSILPDIHDCSHEDAKILWGHMNLQNLVNGEGAGHPDFYSDIKGAFERNYECLQLHCEDIGGVFNTETGRYYRGAEPCGDAWRDSQVQGVESGFEQLLAFAVFCIGISLMCWIVIRRHPGIVPAMLSRKMKGAFIHHYQTTGMNRGGLYHPPSHGYGRLEDSDLELTDNGSETNASYELSQSISSM